ncbi:hypothetical protein IscW_ISCW003149 [Ixodes scapularis]|uniref:Uncharacterized protein n=1 Tax=Ixodes scapularis TaxID=6945 RepID=B7P9V1_IXOSC|nr:hypothetical protein IscW_ISCW003149 [Ixodes scapularis]|eukprot:XP_002405627.1 hypothetical protein IscW_ISCW003149 [Ixodes scapularis]
MLMPKNDNCWKSNREVHAHKYNLDCIDKQTFKSPVGNSSPLFVPGFKKGADPGMPEINVLSLLWQ